MVSLSTWVTDDIYSATPIPQVSRLHTHFLGMETYKFLGLLDSGAFHMLVGGRCAGGETSVEVVRTS